MLNGVECHAAARKRVAFRGRYRGDLCGFAAVLTTKLSGAACPRLLERLVRS